MNFLKAVEISTRTGAPIRRETQTNFGLITNRSDSYRNNQIVKFVDDANVYPLDLEDILAEDWVVKKEK